MTKHLKKTVHSEKSFSTIRSMIALIILFVFGVGGYFSYINYIAPAMSPFYKLIPDELKSYAVGSNADVFILIKNDENISRLLGKYPELAQLNEFKSALILGESKEKAISAIMSFATPEAAKAAKESLESMSTEPIIPSEKATFVLNEKIVIANIGKGLTNFAGNLFDNPNLNSLDRQYLDGQIILYMNNYQMPEATLAMFTLVNTVMGSGIFSNIASIQNPKLSVAHAQEDIKTLLLTGINYSLSLAKETTVYLKIKNSSLQSKLQVNLLSPDEVETAPIWKVLAARAPVKPEDAVKVSREIKTQSEILRPQIQKQIDSIAVKLPGSTINFDINEKSIVIDASFPETFAENGLSLIDAATLKNRIVARDLARIKDLNDIVTAIEQYQSQKTGFGYAYGAFIPSPAHIVKSACVDQIPEIQEYFKSGSSPVDPTGPKDFKVATCKSGYYYDYVKKDAKMGYVVWAKMEGANGNTDSNPDEFKKFQLNEGSNPMENKNGSYYALNKSPFFNEVYIPTSSEQELIYRSQEQISQEMTQAQADAIRGIKRGDDPAGQIAQSNNFKRSSDIWTIAEAVHEYKTAQHGILPNGISTQQLVIGSGAGQANICASIVPVYAASLPFDPTAAGAHFKDCTDYDTGYTIIRNEPTGRIKVSAPGAELNKTIAATR